MPRHMISVSDENWLIWCDTEATWEEDKLFLPGEDALEQLPLNPPTIGWDALESLVSNGEDIKSVTLPTTVEQHFWRVYGERPYHADEYAHSDNDPQAVNGMYQGVSWWVQRVMIPEAVIGQRLELRFRGARLRAEVFLNRQLVGYNIITETPFYCDVSNPAIIGNENILAVRITNHGGRHDWIDGYAEPNAPANMWGEQMIPTSHGFGGLDAGITLTATDRTRIEDIFFQNLTTKGEAAVEITIQNDDAFITDGYLSLSVAHVDAPDDVCWSYSTDRLRLEGGENSFRYGVSIPDVLRWSPDNPHLYRLTATIETKHSSDRFEIRVGFRQFRVKGRGHNAHLYLNDRRIVLRSAITWGIWPNNGLFPTQEFAEKQVQSAKSLGLNTLNYHRNVSNTAVLNCHDEQGLLAMEEPGGGLFAWDDDAFCRAYMYAKVERMMRRDRNHPSLVIYILQNESVDIQPTDPRMIRIMQHMRFFDPSRVIVNQSGLSDVENANEMMRQFAGGVAYYLPHDNNYYRDDGSGFCGWWDQHTVSGPTVYIDSLYNNPKDFKFYSSNNREVVLWGETTPSPAPDDLAWIKSYFDADSLRDGFTRREHLALYDAFDTYLTKNGFRYAFPNLADLTRSAGNRAYDFWFRLMEHARICDAVDGLVINGWETCFYENHSGIVDIFRNPKGDPERLRIATQPLHLAVRSRHVVLHTDEQIVTDVHLVNELNLQGRGQLTVTLYNAAREMMNQQVFEVQVKGGDVFGQCLQSAIVNNGVAEIGYYHLEATLVINDTTLTGQQPVFVVDWENTRFDGTVAIIEREGSLTKFCKQRGLTVEDDADCLIVAEAADVPPSPPATSVLEYLENLVRLRELSQVHTMLTSDQIESVYDGQILILLADDSLVAASWVQQLADAGVVSCLGMVGTPRNVWMGANYFARSHPLLASLPADTVLNWEYQLDMRGTLQTWEKVSVSGGDGALFSGDNVEHIVGYTRDHDLNIGTSLAIIRHGKGQIIISMLPGIYSSLYRESSLHPHIARCLIVNMIRYALNDVIDS